jgi:adenosylhomocysteine nucleosidase
VPLLGMARFPADPELAARLTSAARDFVGADLAGVVARAELEHFGIRAPQVVGGLIASGDKFFASTHDLETLRRELPDAACVEMEGAAVAQVCAEYSVRFGVVRTLSDAADESSPHDFARFARNIARHYSAGILARFLRSR